MSQVLVLCAGSWGITLARLLHRQGHRVRVWEYDPALVRALRATRRHPRLPHMAIPAQIELGGEMPALLEGAEALVCVVPAAHLRTTCTLVADSGYAGQLFVICSKGIEQHSMALPHQVAAEALGVRAGAQIGVLSGPSHAEEVSRDMPAAVTAAAAEPDVAERIRALFMAPTFRVYTQTDVLGVELAAALKNVIAIACGISDGLGFGDNAKAGLITRGLTEITRLGVRMGARRETFAGLAGLGDLVVTCMSRHSRNWRFGSLLGQGRAPRTALDQVGMVVEGYYTVVTAMELSASMDVEMPISEAVNDVVCRGMPPAEAVHRLMLRDAKQEGPA